MLGSGLLGGFGHCMGMCGPLVATYSLALEYRSIAPHLLYNLGRITTYAILGGLIGLSGSFAGVVRSIERFQSITLAFTGTVMIIMALSVGGWMPVLKSGGQQAERKENTGSAIRFLSRAVTLIAGTRSTGAYFPIGLVLGFLPCGLLYTALIGAAAAGMEAKDHIEGLLRGMLLLFLFGVFWAWKTRNAVVCLPVLMIFYFTFVHLFLLAIPRYHVPVLPLVAAIAGGSWKRSGLKK